MDFLASNMDKYNAVICSYKVMQEKFGYSRAALAEAIKLLKQHKYIDIKKIGNSNVYLLNKKIYWNSWGSNYAHAEFEAKVILTSTEQDKETQKEIELQVKKYQHVEAKNDATNLKTFFVLRNIIRKKNSSFTLAATTCRQTPRVPYPHPDSEKPAPGRMPRPRQGRFR